MAVKLGATRNKDMLVSGVKSNNNRKNVAFGWNHATHRFITEKLVAKHNPSLPVSMRLNYEVLKYSCVEPDFSRRNITKYIHGHFADIDNLSNDPPDAFSLATTYTNKAIEAHKRGLYGKRDDYLGYALHFVQDMLNPMHVVFEAVPKGHPERVLHKEFENVSQTVLKDTFKKANIDSFDTEMPFFEKVLPDAMRATKDLMVRIKSNDYDNLSEIATLALDNTFKTTNLYFKRLMRQLYGDNFVFNGPERNKTLSLFDDAELMSA